MGSPLVRLTHPLPLHQLPQCPGLGKTVRETSRPHPNLFLVATQLTIRLSLLPGRLNCIADALSRNNLPLFFTLVSQVDPQSHVTSPRPEPPSPVATEQSLGPIYHNHLSHWCQMLLGFLPRLLADPSPWHERNIHFLQPTAASP